MDFKCNTFSETLNTGAKHTANSRGGGGGGGIMKLKKLFGKYNCECNIVINRMHIKRYINADFRHLKYALRINYILLEYVTKTYT